MDKKRKREETERGRYEEKEEREMGGREGRRGHINKILSHSLASGERRH